MFTRTKIVCTIGPAVTSYEKMVELMQAGMNVARLNFSHGTHAEHLRNIENLKRARKELKKPLALMMDMKGPKLRLGKVVDGVIQLKPKQKIRLVKEEGSKDGIFLDPPEVLSILHPKMKVLFDDGYIVGIVDHVEKDAVVIEIQNAGPLKSNKGVNIPGAILPLPALTQEDLEDLAFGSQHGIDWIAASFVRSQHHLLLIQDFLAKQGCDIPVIAKIESTEGVENFDRILEFADGIMVARGDLGVELDLALVPPLQKKIIRKCCFASKPVITATQMLESMITHPRPTRAEVSDVANAIYDGSSATMLSAETAVGQYPIETVQCMKKIAKEAEDDFNYRHFFEEISLRDCVGIASSLALAAVRTAYSANAKAIFSITTSRETTRFVSRLRPQMPVIAVTREEKHFHQLSLSWGVIPIFCPECTNSEQAFQKAARFAMDEGIIAFGDVIVVTAGTPFGQKGVMNFMFVESVGDVLLRALKGEGHKVTGQVLFVTSPEIAEDQIRGKIVVLTHCDHTFLNVLKKAKGIILQNSLEDRLSEQYLEMEMRNLQGSFVIRAQGAMSILQKGEEITLDPQKGLVYRGSEESFQFSHFPA